MSYRRFPPDDWKDTAVIVVVVLAFAVVLWWFSVFAAVFLPA